MKNNNFHLLPNIFCTLQFLIKEKPLSDNDKIELSAKLKDNPLGIIRSHF